jgi:hypothetical protein
MQFAAEALSAGFHCAVAVLDDLANRLSGLYGYFGSSTSETLLMHQR